MLGIVESVYVSWRLSRRAALILLKAITIRESSDRDKESYPFNLDIIRSLREIVFRSSVTFFAGENGSGKSTVLEAVACAAASVAVGSESVKTDRSLASVRRLARCLLLSWLKRTQKGFFLRAEDFFGYARRMRQTQEDLQAEMVEIERDACARSDFAASQARTPFSNELAAVKSRYGRGLDTRSHGEAFMTLFQARFVPGGLYLLDEPEAALSPTRQLAFLAVLKEMVAHESQFIIATHSPIILAYPEAAILSFDGGAIHEARYEDLENVKLTRDFLHNPQAFLQHLGQ